MSVGDYAMSAVVSGLRGAAGAAAGNIVGSKIGEVLAKNGLMTPFMEFVKQSATGFASAGANIGTGYALSGEKPTKEQIATDMATAFLFSVIQGGISTFQTTMTDKAKMEYAVDEIARRYNQMSKMSFADEAERSAAAEEIIRQTQDLKAQLNRTYIAGQQKTVNQLNNALDAITESLGQYVTTPFTGGTTPNPTAGVTGIGGTAAGEIVPHPGYGGGLSTPQAQDPTQPILPTSGPGTIDPVTQAVLQQAAADMEQAEAGGDLDAALSGAEIITELSQQGGDEIPAMDMESGGEITEIPGSGLASPQEPSNGAAVSESTAKSDIPAVDEQGPEEVRAILEEAAASDDDTPPGMRSVVIDLAPKEETDMPARSQSGREAVDSFTKSLPTALATTIREMYNEGQDPGS